MKMEVKMEMEISHALSVCNSHSRCRGWDLQQKRRDKLNLAHLLKCCPVEGFWDRIRNIILIFLIALLDS